MKKSNSIRRIIQAVVFTIAGFGCLNDTSAQTQAESAQTDHDKQLRALTAPEAPRFPITDRVWPEKIGDAHLCLWKDDKLGAISFTIDDNCRPDHAWWVARGRDYGWSFTWFVITGRIGGNSSGFYGDWKDYSALLEAGHDVQSHTVNHLDPQRGYTDIKGEYAPSIEQIEKHLPGHQVTTLAYPGGPRMHENDHELAASIFTAARGVVGHINSANAINYNNTNSISTLAFDTGNWADLKNLIRPEGDGTGRGYRGWYCCHYHSLKPKLKDTLLKAMDYIKEHEADLWVDTFRNVAQYGQERDTATVKVVHTAEGSRRRFTILLQDDMDDHLFSAPITIKLRVPSDWKQAKLKQGHRTINVQSIQHNGGIYVLLPIVPDGGKAVVEQSQTPLSSIVPKTNPSEQSTRANNEDE